jgi:amino acid permease
VAAVATISIVFIVYGTTAYFAYGEMEQQMVFQLLPKGSFFVRLLMFFNIIILMMTYPLTINPANSTLEAWTIEKWFPKRKSGLRNERKPKIALRTILKNISRFFIVLSAAYLGIELSEVLDKFVGLIGALFCTPLGMILPTLCHLKLAAKTKQEKINDLVILVVSMLIMVLCID